MKRTMRWTFFRRGCNHVTVGQESHILCTRPHKTSWRLQRRPERSSRLIVYVVHRHRQPRIWRAELGLRANFQNSVLGLNISEFHTKAETKNIQNCLAGNSPFKVYVRARNLVNLHGLASLEKFMCSLLQSLCAHKKH